MMRIFDQAGVEHDREPVDCRELLAQGWTREPPVAPAENVEPLAGNDYGKPAPGKGKA